MERPVSLVIVFRVSLRPCRWRLLLLLFRGLLSAQPPKPATQSTRLLAPAKRPSIPVWLEIMWMLGGPILTPPIPSQASGALWHRLVYLRATSIGYALVREREHTAAWPIVGGARCSERLGGVGAVQFWKRMVAVKSICEITSLSREMNSSTRNSRAYMPL